MTPEEDRRHADRHAQDEAYDDASYWNYIQSDTPNAWHTDNKNHGLIVNIGTSNTFKQQLKIQGRSGRDLFEMHDDGSAVTTIKGRLNCTEGLKVDGKPVATEEYAAETYLKRAGGTSSKMQGILYLGGHKIAGVAEPERSDDAATRGYVDNAVFSGGGGSFQTKYDGNRECIANGVSTSTLDRGQVMFLNQALVSTTNPSLVECIGLPLEDFNWASCIKSGVIKVKNGAHEAGYYQVFKTKENNGRNMLVYVKPIWFDAGESSKKEGPLLLPRSVLRMTVTFPQSPGRGRHPGKRHHQRHPCLQREGMGVGGYAC